MRHHQMGQLQQIPPLMPFWQAQEGIHAHDQTEAPVRILVTQLGQGLDRVGRPLFAHLSIVDHEAGLPGGRQLNHLKPKLCVGQGLVAVRWIAGRKKANLLEPQGLLQFEGGAQMCVVNRVEGAAEDAHGIHVGTLPDSVLACKAPARPPARPVSALHASPGASPLMTRSVWPAWMSNRDRGSVLSRDSARGVGVAARFQPLPRSAERSRSRSRACHNPRSSRTRAHKIRVGSTPSLLRPRSTRRARSASPAAAASASWNTSYRALSPTDRNTKSALMGSPSASRLSFSSSCFAASRFPSTRSTINCAAAGSISTLSCFARDRSHAGSAAVWTGQIGTQIPCFSTARTQAASLAFLSSLSVTTKHTTSGGGRSARSTNCCAPLSGLPLGIRSSKRRRSANNDSDWLACRNSSQAKLRSMKNTVRSA